MHTGFFNSIDFAADGKFVDTVNLPYSVDRSPYYQIRIPICRVKNGDGPSLLLIAGNHGDEYEGPIALSRFIQALRADSIRGSITILPALNAPAVEAHRRCSPFDGGNLNRSFPGNSTGGPTERIAAFVTQELTPIHDVMFDLHSGGTSMEHIVCGIMELSGDESRDARARELMETMQVPYVLEADNGADTPTSLGVAMRAGIVGISGEFGGGASLTPSSVHGTTVAIDNVLVRMGILPQPLLTSGATSGAETVFLGLDNQNLYVYADGSGWFEPAVSIGERVTKGQGAGRVYDLFSPANAPRDLHFDTDGVVIAKRLHAHIKSGDCLYALGRFL